MKQDEATLNAEQQSNGNPSVGRQAFIKAVFLASAVLGLLTLCLSCAHLSPKPVLVVFETELGNITVEVDVVHAPITGKNFLRYVDAKFYEGGMINRAVRPDNTVRHDVEVQVIQFQSDPARARALFPPIPMERTSVTGLKHVNGVLSMARMGPDTAQDSFSIVIGNQPAMDFNGRRNPDGQGFAVFGRVVTGMDTVKKIHQAHTGRKGSYQTETLEPPIKILKAYRKEQAKGQIHAQEQARDKINWPAFLHRHDMIFNKLPQGWNEAPHFGNAMVGSMLYQVDDTIRLQVFRADVHDHRDDTWGWTAYSRPRLQIGYFSLHPVGKLTGCKWRKDLWNAELTGTITTDRGEIRIRHFTHAVDMAIVTELTPSDGESGCNWTWHPAEARTSRGGYPTAESGIAKFAKQYGAHYERTLKIWQPNPTGRLEEHGETSVWIQDLLAGGQYATAWTEQVLHARRTHIVSIANSYPATNAAAVAKADVERFMKLNRTSWVQAHRDWWHDYYPRSFVTLPDKSLESLYWQTIYRYGCTTRAGRCFVDTPGIWLQGKSWPYFTTDWNIQSAHWAVYAANRLEQGQALVDRLHERHSELIKAVRPVEWQEDSAYLPIAVAWDMAGTREGDMRYYDLVGNLPWTMHNLWMQYRYSMDDALLREKIYPLLRRAINLYLHMVREEPDGKLHLPPTYSPETGVFADCNFDLALFKWGCHTLLKSSQRLKLDDPLIPRWKSVVERLPDYPADEHGFRLGRDKSSSANHQHFSNLLMIYPLHLVNIKQQGAADVLKRSFDRARSTVGPGQRQAMVEAHVGPIAAALGLGDEALESLRRLQGDLYPNGLWYESPCIESTLAAANIIQDMLIQSWSDPALDEPSPIRIFPAVPSAWKDLEFHDLRAEGAFLVSAKRSAGETEWVRIRSLAGEPCRVRPNLPGEIRLMGERAFKLQTLSPGTYQIDLKRGEEVLLFPGTESSSLPVQPSSPRAQRNQ